MKIFVLALVSILVMAAATKNHEDFHNGNYGKKTAYKVERNNPYIRDIHSKVLPHKPLHKPKYLHLLKQVKYTPNIGEHKVTRDKFRIIR